MFSRCHILFSFCVKLPGPGYFVFIKRIRRQKSVYETGDCTVCVFISLSVLLARNPKPVCVLMLLWAAFLSFLYALNKSFFFKKEKSHNEQEAYKTLKRRENREAMR